VVDDEGPLVLKGRRVSVAHVRRQAAASPV
jgi:hypothetical protein